MMSLKESIKNICLYNKETIKRIPLVGSLARSIYRRKISSSNNIDYSSLSVTEIKRLMDERFNTKQAYMSSCLWDNVRGSEIRKNAIRLISPTTGKRILELGCGTGGNVSSISECEEYIGTELSEVAVSQASESFKNKSNFRFMVMDAMDLRFDDNQFDIVIATEVIEHLPDAQKMLSESYRVLKPDGKLLISSPNRDSIHLRVNRMLGYKDFTCSFDHVKEFTFQEVSEMLVKEGFVVAQTVGVFLQPFWGIPKIDYRIRKLTDIDPHMVEMLRELGERAGAEYAFCYVILSVKPKK